MVVVATSDGGDSAQGEKNTDSKQNQKHTPGTSRIEEGSKEGEIKEVLRGQKGPMEQGFE